ncbi:metal ABC transporter solute-binding protein, Zn/Mn family [Fervidibacillus albus]|uniref:Zinc ABC transporter substrate-binding protein n=1 Tax=Fervidibacillus albus TaxID=2980026 RepID=A0A9E8LUR6_9BACI|nr:zinc ABC transporter substrate-binding protein [Fervidibacillus albus]WAA10048.1 zinc ABC transporter substrate-binding protein [Fervidibacillus albus]
MKKRIFFLFSFILLIAPILNGCGETTSQNNVDEDGEEFVIYTTVYPLQFFAEQIGGQYVQVETIYPPGVDEHTYEPSQKDMINMAEGDMFLYIGYSLEGFAETAKPILEDEGVRTVAVGEMIQLDVDDVHDEENEEATTDDHDHEGETDEATTDDHDHEGETDEATTDDHDHEGEDTHSDEDGHNHTIDPHIWVDPIYSKEMAKVILDELIDAIPDKEEIFTENYEQLANKLDQLHEQFTEVTDQAQIKEFIVSHAAYGYWEKRYGLTQLSIAGISSAEEPSQKQLQEIIDLVQDYELQYILVEQNISNNLVEVVQREAGVEALSIHNLSVLTENDIEEDRDYFSIMESNIETLKKALKVE